MKYDIRLDQCSGEPLAVVRRIATPDELPRVIPDACGLVWGVVRSRQIPGAGRHVAVYLDDRLTLEIGVELDAPFGGHGEVIDSATPSGPVAATIHRGPYGGLREAHQAIRAWCQDNGHRMAGPRWEVYGHWEEAWNDDPSKITVDVFYLLNEAESTDSA
ncbi:MAG: hypothetical protein U0800_23770 [Isosphaeraceae bacterium]